MNVAEARRRGRALLAAGESPAVDCDWLLAAAVGRERGWLRAHDDYLLSMDEQTHFETLLARRAAGEPVAYLLGSCGFWTLELQLTEGVLIPRPDTERLVELTLAELPAGAQRVADLGAGSGAIALALASERPAWQLLAVERSAAAVAVVRANLKCLRLTNVALLQADWNALPAALQFDAIVSNPPYIADQDPHLFRGDVAREPRTALVAGADGLDAIREIIALADRHLLPGGLLAFEHGYDQASAVAALLAKAGFRDVRSVRDLGGHQRVTAGRCPGGVPHDG